MKIQIIEHRKLRCVEWLMGLSDVIHEAIIQNNKGHMMI